jgi:orotate phosphoribosyltransferase
LTVIRILAILSLDADWSNPWLYFGETVDKTWAIELLRSAGALLEGHFLLSSGNHSNAYIQCALLLARPEIAHDFMEDMAEHYREQKIDTVAAPAVGGIIVAYEVAKILGKRAIFLERENGVMSLRRGFSISRGERILIVEDVITTGGSVIEVGEVLREQAGIITGFASIVNRSSGRFNPAKSYYYCVEMEVPIYNPLHCPLCSKNLPLVKPGSRSIKK